MSSLYGAYEKYQTEIEHSAKVTKDCLAFSMRWEFLKRWKRNFFRRKMPRVQIAFFTKRKCSFSSLKIILLYPSIKSFLSFGRENKTRRKALTRNSFHSTSSRKRMWRGGHSNLSFGFIAIPILSPVCLFFFQTRAFGDNRRTCNFQCHNQKREGNVEGNKEIDG